jgi:hypothetical protein
MKLWAAGLGRFEREVDEDWTLVRLAGLERVRMLEQDVHALVKLEPHRIGFVPERVLFVPVELPRIGRADRRIPLDLVDDPFAQLASDGIVVRIVLIVHVVQVDVVPARNPPQQEPRHSVAGELVDPFVAVIAVRVHVHVWQPGVV